MSENSDSSHSRGAGPGGGRGGGGGGEGRGQPPPQHQQQQARGGNNGHHQQQQEGFGNSNASGFVQQQDYSSWRNPMAAAGMAAAPTADAAYNNFYYSGGYTPFSAGDIRDSIAAIWSRASPSGAGGAGAGGDGGVPPFSGHGYGQFDSSHQFAANSSPAAAGQFAANLTGHFAATNDLSMFGGAGDYAAAAYGSQQQQGYGGYGGQYTQWGDSRNNGSSYSYLGSGGGMQGDDGRGGVREVQQGMDGMKLSGGGAGKKSESNGYQSTSSSSATPSSQPKKMSWASVASQPAKPQAPVTKTKKPGVLPPPAIIPSAKPALAPTTPAAPPPSAGSAGPPEMPASMTTKSESLMTSGESSGPSMMTSGPPLPSGPPPPSMNHHHNHPSPPPLSHHLPPSNDRPSSSHMGHRDVERRGGGMDSGPPPRTNMNSTQGPRGAAIRANTANGSSPLGGFSSLDRGGGGGPSSGMSMNIGGGTKSHPVLDTLKSANDYNPRNFDLNPTNARFFVIKSFSEDDIHRSIKYEIWCSTDHGNKRLDNAFKERNGRGPVYLLFSVNGSGHFCGMAQMLSGVDYSTASSVWVQDKFKGQFKVRWIYVKDVPNGQLRHIRLENNENKPVTNSRDTQEVPPEKGKLVLKIIHGYKHNTSIFDDFVHYEKRQEEEEGKKSMAAAAAAAATERHHMMDHRDYQPHRGGRDRDGGGSGGRDGGGRDRDGGGGGGGRDGGGSSRGGGDRRNHYNHNARH